MRESQADPDARQKLRRGTPFPNFDLVMSRIKQVTTLLGGVKKSMDRTTIGTIGAGVFAQFALVISGIVAARALGVEDRGRLALVQSVAIASSFVISLGLPVAIAFWVAKNEHSSRPVLRAARGVIVAQLLLAVVVPAALLIAIFADAEENVQLAATISLPATFVLIVGLYVAGMLQGLHRFLAYNIFRTAPILAYGLGVLTLWIFGYTELDDFVLIYITAWGIAALIGARIVLKSLPPDSNEPVAARPLVVYGLKGQIGNASPLENFQIDQLIIAAIGGPVVLGFYVGGMAFTNLPRFVAMSIGAVAFPRTAASLETGGATRKALDALVLTLVVSLAVIIPLEFLVGWLIPLLFGDAFEASIPVARVLLISALFLSLRRVLGDVMRGGGVPLPSTAAEIVSWITYAICIYPLMERSGATGAAIAMTLASATSLLWLTIAAIKVIRKHHNIQPPSTAENAGA